MYPEILFIVNIYIKTTEKLKIGKLEYTIMPGKNSEKSNIE